MSTVPEPRADAERLDTIPITCAHNGQAHDVTDDSLTAGQRAGYYQALCGHLVSAAALAAPIGRPCARCTAVKASRRGEPATARGDRARSRFSTRHWPGRRNRTPRFAGIHRELGVTDTYTDGASSGNPGPGGRGAVVRYGTCEPTYGSA